MTLSRWSERIAAVASLGDATRRALFDYVRRAGHPVGREEAAHALGLSRGVAAAQLDRLAEEGILKAAFAKAGPGGPGTGRPSKFYTAAAPEVLASVPERRYELAGELIASAAERSMELQEPMAESLQKVGHEEGSAIGRRQGSIEAVLEATGYAPVPCSQEDEGCIELANCPFHALALRHRGLVCTLNGALLTGALEGCADSGHRLEPIEPGQGHGECCARIVPA